MLIIRYIYHIYWCGASFHCDEGYALWSTCEDVRTLSNLHQSPAWISKYDDNGPFQGGPCRISLSFCTDGMNPFSMDMWPITLTILNLTHLCNLAGITPGKSEPKNFDPYMMYCHSIKMVVPRVSWTCALHMHVQVVHQPWKCTVYQPCMPKVEGH